MTDTLDPALEAALDPKALDATVVWFNENFNGLPNALALVIGIVKTYRSVASPQAEIDRLREALRPFGQMLIYSVEEDPALYVAFDKRTLAQLDPNSPEGAAALKLEAALSHARAILSEVAR